MSAQPFRNRIEAGQALAEKVADHLEAQGDRQGVVVRQHVVVLGLARGGVPVAAEVAARLQAPLDVLVVRKLAAPSQPEFAFGAIAEQGATVIDAETVALLRLRPDDVDAIRLRETDELARRVHEYRGGRPLIDLRAKHAILVDDGLATGATMRAAVQLAEHNGAAEVSVAVPVAAAESLIELEKQTDVVCVHAPAHFGAVGSWYRDFQAPTDDEICALLR